MRSRRPPACLGNINMLAKCCGKPCGLDRRFRRANFEAILEITGARARRLCCCLPPQVGADQEAQESLCLWEPVPP